MLRSIQKLALAAALAATLAPAAFADGESTNEHTVMVLGASFFPRVTYASPGDTVRFINASEAEQSIVAKDENWTVGPIAIEGEEIFTVFAGMKTISAWSWPKMPTKRPFRTLRARSASARLHSATDSAQGDTLWGLLVVQTSGSFGVSLKGFDQFGPFGAVRVYGRAHTVHLQCVFGRWLHQAGGTFALFSQPQ